MSPEDERIIKYAVPGARYTVVAIAHAKWFLTYDIPNDARLTLLEFLNGCTELFTLDAIAAVEPMPPDGRELFKEATKLGRKGPAGFCIVGLLNNQFRGTDMTISTVLLIILVLILIGAVPTWPHSRSWGYGPSGIVGVVLVVLLILVLMGRI